MLVARYGRRKFFSPPDVLKPFEDDDMTDIAKRVESKVVGMALQTDKQARALKYKYDETPGLPGPLACECHTLRPLVLSEILT